MTFGLVSRHLSGKTLERNTNNDAESSGDHVYSVKCHTWTSSGDFTAPSSLGVSVSSAGTTAEPKAWCSLPRGWHRHLGPTHDLDDLEKCFWFLAPREREWRGCPFGSAQCQVTGEISCSYTASPHSAAAPSHLCHPLPPPSFQHEEGFNNKMRGDLSESL